MRWADEMVVETLHSERLAKTGAVLLLALVFGVAVFGSFVAVGAEKLHVMYVLVAACTIGLVLSGASMSRTIFGTRASWPFVLVILLMGAGWAWQQYAYAAFGLGTLRHDYEFSRDPDTWLPVTNGPVAVIAAAFLIILAVATIVAWRRGARAPIVLLLFWVFVAFIVFCIPAIFVRFRGSTEPIPSSTLQNKTQCETRVADLEVSC